MLDDDFSGSAHVFYTQAEVREMNDNFADAMRNAKAKGLERFNEGVFKDDTPFSPTYFAREMMARSFTGSSADVCVEEMPAQPTARPAPKHLSK
jgi:hypothetical protein